MKFRNLVGQVTKKITDDVEKELTRLVLTCENEAKKSMHGGGPSEPGEPPHVDTGRLRASITHEVERTLFGVVGRVGTNVKYGRYLELGTSKMMPRPWLRPALRRTMAMNHDRRI